MTDLLPALILSKSEVLIVWMQTNPESRLQGACLAFSSKPGQTVISGEAAQLRPLPSGGFAA